ncbi:hypothetical protein B1H10_01830 [candidate division KSB1 bacterium 4484_188]|nr:MAG: hypothetical protein B1H10_01830 [candidate division KSB1 bacterium 4484_188]
MKNKKYHSLRWQITLLILVGAIVFSSVILLVTYRYVDKILTDSIIEEGRIVAENVAELAAEKLIEDDIVALKTMIEKYKYYSSIEYILIEDFNNQVKTDTYNGKIPSELVHANMYNENSTKGFSVKVIQIVSQNIAVFDILQPVKEGLLGFVRIGMKKSAVDEKVKETIFRIGLVFFIGTFLAIILAVFIITLQINRPIAYLTETASKISMGEFNIPVQVKTKNEIGILGEAIERMRESLKTSIERLRNR